MPVAGWAGWFGRWAVLRSLRDEHPNVFRRLVALLQVVFCIDFPSSERWLSLLVCHTSHRALISSFSWSLNHWANVFGSKERFGKDWHLGFLYSPFLSRFSSIVPYFSFHLVSTFHFSLNLEDKKNTPNNFSQLFTTLSSLGWS